MKLIVSTRPHEFRSTTTAVPGSRQIGRERLTALAHPCADGNHSATMKEDTTQTRRDIRAAVIFGVIAATIELGVLVYFFR